MKSGFLSELDVSLINGSSAQGRGMWRVDAPLRYYDSWTNKILIVPVGFVTDFASVPRLPVVFLLFGDVASEAATLHDWLYTEKPFKRRRCDAILRKASITTGVPRWRAWGIWAGVRIFGGRPWRGESWV